MFICLPFLLTSLVRHDYWVVTVATILIFFLFFLVKTSTEEFLWGIKLDFLSFNLIILTFIIIIFINYSSTPMFTQLRKSGYYRLLLISLTFSVLIVFLVQKIILFYLIFEAALIPVFFLFLGWGANPEKLESGIYILIYTLVGSFPFLIFFLLYLSSRNLALFYFYQNFIFNLRFTDRIFLGLRFIIFLAKIPIFSLHL